MYIGEILPWDGTSLGIYNKNIVLKRILDKWIMLDLKNINVESFPELANSGKKKRLICIQEKYKNDFPILIDSVKPIFGLMKRGIHTITINRQKYILYYVQYQDGTITEEVKLKELPKKNFLRKDFVFTLNVQKILLFREIFSLTNNNESNIVVRKIGVDHFFPVSINEKNYKYKEKRITNNVISQNMYLKWSSNFTKKELLYSSFKISLKSREMKSIDHLPIMISSIQNDIENIFKSSKKDYSTYLHTIIEYVSLFLLY